MNSLKNKVQLLGNLGDNPEIREFDGGRKMARIRIATNDSYKDKAGEWQDDTQWHSVVCWGAAAELVEKSMRKGAQVVLDGRLVHRKYEAKDGTTRYSTEVVMNNFTVLRKATDTAPAVVA